MFAMVEVEPLDFQNSNLDPSASTRFLAIRPEVSCASYLADNSGMDY